MCEAKVTISQIDQIKPQMELPTVLEYTIVGPHTSGTSIQPNYDGI